MCEDVGDARLTLRPEPTSVGVARRFFRENSCPRQDADQVDVALLLVSELVTNAIRHGSPPITLKLTCGSQHVVEVRVTDAGPELPVPGEPDIEDDHGRGLAITAVLSDDWGAEPHDEGKTVWFRLQPRSLQRMQDRGPGAAPSLN